MVWAYFGAKKMIFLVRPVTHHGIFTSKIGCGGPFSRPTNCAMIDFAFYQTSSAFMARGQGDGGEPAPTT